MSIPVIGCQINFAKALDPLLEKKLESDMSQKNQK
jgi:hypothetical protein